MSYKLNELKQLVREARRESEWEKFLTHIRESYLLESPLFLKEASILKNKYPFKAIFVLGPAGAGKSFLSNNIGIPKEFKISNPDERIENVFPAFGISMKFVGEKEAGEDPTGQKQKRMDIEQGARNALSNATVGHTANLLMIANPLVFDTTGEDPEKMIPRMENLVRLGYDVGIFQVNVPTDVSVTRDKERKRTVGEYTKTISQDYQKNVAQDKAYLNLAAKHAQEPVEEEDPETGEMVKVNKSLIRTFGEAVYPNLYNIETGELLDGITQAHVDEIAPGLTPEDAKAILGQARDELMAWLKPVPYNATGQKILSGMKAMVKATGKYGQNMMHLSMAGAVVTEHPQIKDSPEIMAAIKEIEGLVGEDGTIQNAVVGYEDEKGEYKKGGLQSTKGEKDLGGQGSIRSMSGSDQGNRRKMQNIQWEKERAAEIEKVKQGKGKYKDLSPEEKEKKIAALHSKKKQDKEKYEERLSKEAIYNIVKNAIN